LKKILIIEDREDIRDTYLDYFPVYFPEFSVVAIGTFDEAKAYALSNFSEIEFAVLDGELDENKLSYPIAVAMREAGFKGGIYLVSGKDKEMVIPSKSAQAAFTDFFIKPFSIGEFKARIRKNLPA
jgi:DNA-binding response OmpR family regulator